MATPFPTITRGQPILATDFIQLIEAIQDRLGAGGAGGNGNVTGGAEETPVDPYAAVFIAQMTGAKQWQEETLVGAAIVDFTDGRACTSDSDPSAALPLTGDQALAIEVRDGDDFRYAILRSPMFPVLVKKNGGSDGTATTYASWTYDIYALFDTGYTSPLNGGTPLAVDCSRARAIKGPVTAAANGSTGEAYVKSDGTYGLFNLQEVHSEGPCTES